jgi:tetratricopeptide (TPR) repeat protein
MGVGRSVSAFAFALALLAASPAAAQRASRAERHAAERLFRAGRDLDARGKFVDAAASYRSAYEKVPDPSYLIDEGRSFERANALERAIDSYEEYLSAAPDAGDVVDVERKVATLRARLQARDGGGEEAPAVLGAGTAPAIEEDRPARNQVRESGAGFHTHTIAALLAPVFWLSAEEPMFRVAFEYRWTWSDAGALAVDLMYIPPLVSGRTNQLSGLGVAAFYLGTIALTKPWAVLLRAGPAFESYSRRSADAIYLAVRLGPGIEYAFSDAVKLSLEALFSAGLYFIDSNTLEGGSGNTELVPQVEPAVTLALGL